MESNFYFEEVKNPDPDHIWKFDIEIKNDKNAILIVLLFETNYI